MQQSQTEQSSSLSRRALMVGAASIPLVTAFGVSAAEAATQSWDQWSARMASYNASGTSVQDPGRSQTGECTHLWRDYLVYAIGAPWGAGNSGIYAKHLWTNYAGDAEAVAALYQVARTSTGYRGDGVIWDERFNPGYPDGHVAVLIEDLGSSVRVWSQNNAAPGGARRYPEIKTYSKAYVYGYLRPRSIPTPVGGFLMALSDAQQQEIYNALVAQPASGGRYYKTDALINDGRANRDQVITKIREADYPPGQPYTWGAALNDRIAELKAQVDQIQAKVNQL